MQMTGTCAENVPAIILVTVKFSAKRCHQRGCLARQNHPTSRRIRLKYTEMVRACEHLDPGQVFRGSTPPGDILRSTQPGSRLLRVLAAACLDTRCCSTQIHAHLNRL